MSTLKVFVQPLGDFSTNAYIVVCGSKAIAIDAPMGSFKFYSNIVKEYNLTLNTLLLTHSHFDHIVDALAIQNMGVKVGIHPLDRPNCEKPGADGLPQMMHVEPLKPDFDLKEEKMEIDGFNFLITHTPGHTPGGVVILLENLLFTGDTLFKGSIGNLSFPSCDPSAMVQSLKKLCQMDDSLKIYPGHGPSSILGLEKSYMLQIIHRLGNYDA
jgi:glyoxylase-like metal-dependent hydrolase (beta-lactamase superfamily II)